MYDSMDNANWMSLFYVSLFFSFCSYSIFYLSLSDSVVGFYFVYSVVIWSWTYAKNGSILSTVYFQTLIK
jgi:hypothetical protein